MILAGCGGGGGSTEPTAAAGAQHDSGGGSAQFRVKGGDNSVQEFGAEASESELHRAAAALHGFFDARAGRHWATACTYLAAGVVRPLEHLTAGSQPPGGNSCAASLAAFSAKVSDATLSEAAEADVGSLRTAGARGFLIYRGAGGGANAISMVREDEVWKVASLSGLPLD